MKRCGLFETMRWYNYRTVYFTQHIARMKKSAALIGLAFPFRAAQLKNKISKAVRRLALRDAHVRLTLERLGQGVEIFLVVKAYRPNSVQKYHSGFSAFVSGLRQRNLLSSQIKSTQRSLYERSLAQAKKRRHDEAIILNQRGHIAEGSRSNVFFIKNKILFTPALGCGCLAGVTRQVILAMARQEKRKTVEGKFIVRDLEEADEAFLTNSLIGVMPLTKIGEKQIGKGRIGKISATFLKKYHSLLKK